MPRTLVNRIWQRLFGRGIVGNPDEMDGEPWSPAIARLDRERFRRSAATISSGCSRRFSRRTRIRCASLAAFRRRQPSAYYVFRGPEIRRLTAEQFADAIGVHHRRMERVSAAGSRLAARRPLPAGPPPGRYTREWQTPASSLARALGRPIRDQVFSTRSTTATMLQALELVNGERLANWLLHGARNMLGELPPPATALFVTPITSRGARAATPPQSRTAPSPFDVDVSRASRVWLIVQNANSTAVYKAEAAWARAEFVGRNGETTPMVGSDATRRIRASPGIGPLRVR